MEHNLPDSHSRHMRNKKIKRSSRHGSSKAITDIITNLIVFCDEMTVDGSKGDRMYVKRLLRPPPQHFKW